MAALIVAAALLATSPLNGEALISLTQAAKLLPGARGSSRRHPATLTRWIINGSRAVDGRRVRLEAIRCGSSWATSAAALARFCAALAGNLNSEAPTPAPRPARNAPAAAGDRLASAGW